MFLRAMLEADEEQVEHEQTLKDRSEHRGSKGERGHYERKLIKGCGPYLYLRYWSGGNTVQYIWASCSELHSCRVRVWMQVYSKDFVCICTLNHLGAIWESAGSA